MVKRYKRRRRAFRKARVYNRRYPTTVKTTSIAQGNSVDTTIAKARGMYQDYYSLYNKYKPLAVQAYQVGTKALEMLNAEKKYYDISQTTVTPANPSGSYTVVSLVSSISQGDGPTNRDGSQIRLKSINVQLAMQINAAATTTNVRWVLFRDMRPQLAAAPTYIDLYDSTDVINTFLNIEDQWRRFKIIRSGLVTLNINQNPYSTTDLYVPCSLPIRYSTSNDVINTNIYLMLVSNEATNTPSVAYRYRVRFYDN